MLFFQGPGIPLLSRQGAQQDGRLFLALVLSPNFFWVLLSSEALKNFYLAYAGAVSLALAVSHRPTLIAALLAGRCATDADPKWILNLAEKATRSTESQVSQV